VNKPDASDTLTKRAPTSTTPLTIRKSSLNCCAQNAQINVDFLCCTRSELMPSTDFSLAVGRPDFDDESLSALNNSLGALSAWREAVRRDPASAALGVTGSFAVGFTDGLGRTFLAVDRFSICTICYRIHEGRLRFASRADELSELMPDLDPQAIFDYLYFHVIPSPRTIYKNIYRLQPGHYALFDNGRLLVAPYWSPAFEPLQEASFPSLKFEFKELLQAAVERQLDGSRPACFLSGGTDSSTVAGMATLACATSVATYSIGFDVQGYDEMDYARLASRHFNTHHHEYYVKPNDLLNGIPSIAGHYDQPFGNSSALPAYFCAKVARDDGVCHLLAGDGGDELFGGNSRYAKQKIFGWYKNVPPGIKRDFLEPLLRATATGYSSLGRKARSYVEQASIQMPERLQANNLLMRLGAANVLSSKFLQQIDPDGPLKLQQSIWRAPRQCGDLDRELAFDWRFTLADSDLPKVVGATAFAGIGVGFPLLDERLLNFSLKLPAHYKLRGLKLRWFFKEALRGFLPDEIINKRKQGFGLPFGVWALQNPKLGALARDSLDSLTQRGIVRKDFVLSLLTQRLPEHPGYFGEMVWILMMLEQWLRAHAPFYKVT
jgi:asparagine synthase (glutamine-hydrolysing)